MTDAASVATRNPMATAPLAPLADTPLERDGLTYPFGDRSPQPGELIEIAPGLHWWRLPMWGPLKHVNGYVLDGPEGLTLIDTGFNNDTGVAAWGALLGGPLAGKRVAQVLCTHYHPDHVGLAGWLCRQHDAPLLMTRTEWLQVRMLCADSRDEIPEEMIAFWRGAGWDDAQIACASERGWGNFERIVARLPLGFRRIAEGDVLRIGGAAWEVVTGNGHSPEHACLLDAKRGILIAGDQVLPRISSNISLGVSEPEGDPLGDWLASIAKLKSLPADLLVLPGHGEPFTGLHTRLDQLDAEHRQRLDAVAAHLATPRRAVDCFTQLFRRPIGPDVIGMATGEALAHLRHLEVEGRAARDVRDGVWWFRAT
ncbi:MBL fold metallo-hydrolase [Sphingomonas sp.]|jgi:glyoxylase-like metal-dependent hydrolase (beta-lactamase superfamily II)|uniref:MBL fold metallo-hydrolase n=1 Tax=Sphingomonas sp. TaxID=28214 RepID=UPI002D7FCB13|nr:MBL fold metallo-hydrolase [Sphingomonas sp.]HEU0043474.1 MBL fold metallo-hydrolase [Sphingomonas sp.]